MRNGFVELRHTADLAIRVRANDFNNLMVESARGMYAMMGIVLEDSSFVERNFELDATMDEGLLVAFLNELLFINESEREVFTNFNLRVEDDRLMVSASGRKMKSQRKEIKAVTFHKLEIKQKEEGLEVEIVFDV